MKPAGAARGWRAFWRSTRERHPDYWARPVPSFGAARPRILIVGLAPGMHGANRTGRPFTGDHAGILLYQTLYAAGLASAAGIGERDDALEPRECAHHQRRQVRAAREQTAAGGDPPLQPLIWPRSSSSLRAGARVPGARPRGARGAAAGARAPARTLSFCARRRARARGGTLADRFVSLQPLQHRHAAGSPRRCSARWWRAPASAPGCPRAARSSRPRLERVRSQGIHRRPAASARACTACSVPGQELLYVGKARSLKDRVGTYFAASNVDPKVQALVAQISAIEVTVTNSETEALLLEYNLIKAHKPRFNIVLRDDKSFPYIHLYVEHEFRAAGVLPRLAQRAGTLLRAVSERRRGARDAEPAAEAVSHPQLRDSFFANRSRPCLQHQIGRCSAPCVGLISREAYAQDMAAAVKVLEGRNDEVQRGAAGAHGGGRRPPRIRARRAAARPARGSAARSGAAGRHCGERARRRRVRHRRRGGRIRRRASCWCAAGATSAPPAIFPRAPLAEPHEALASFVMQYYASAEVARRGAARAAVSRTPPRSPRRSASALGHARARCAIRCAASACAGWR